MELRGVSTTAVWLIAVGMVAGCDGASAQQPVESVPSGDENLEWVGAVDDDRLQADDYPLDGFYEVDVHRANDDGCLDPGEPVEEYDYFRLDGRRDGDHVDYELAWCETPGAESCEEATETMVQPDVDEVAEPPVAGTLYRSAFVNFSESKTDEKCRLAGAKGELKVTGDGVEMRRVGLELSFDDEETDRSCSAGDFEPDFAEASRKMECVDRTTVYGTAVP